MSFSIHYRSTETMHPAQAFAIKQRAECLAAQYSWMSCEPVSLNQQSDGYLGGESRTSVFPAEADPVNHPDGELPDGTVLSLAEVLCVLSREHGVDWDICNEYEPEPIGQIVAGVAADDLIEQLETFGTIGDLLDDPYEHQWATATADDHSAERASTGEEVEDDGPRLLKFPGSDG